MDEVDALGSARGGSFNASGEGTAGDGCSRRVLTELLLQLNNIGEDPRQVNRSSNASANEEVDSEKSDDDDDDDSPRILVVAATNRPQDCDPALLRRFSLRLYVGLPSTKDRKKLLVHLLRDIAHSLSALEMERLAGMTDGWSGSDMESLTREAAMAPIRDCLREAAQWKKRQQRQSGGAASAQEDDEGDRHSNAHEQARGVLLSNLEKLRPVSLQDFERALDFGFINDQSMGSYGTVASPAIEYDSSSDEEG